MIPTQRHTIRLTHDGLPCWHIVEVHPLKLPLLKKLQAGEAVDITTLGRIIASGWGEPPPETVDYSTIDA